MKTITIEKLFEGLEPQIIAMIKDVVATSPRPSDAIEKHLKPMMPKIEQNAGQEMDIKYVWYLLLYAMEKGLNESSFKRQSARYKAKLPRR